MSIIYNGIIYDKNNITGTIFPKDLQPTDISKSI